jgi:hydroxyethylthiazole kinase-like uncharacterized protein yjeF
MPFPYPIYSIAEIRELELAARGLHDMPKLMERAGTAAAEIARELLGDGTSVLVIAGPGNNGGDALVAARTLKEWWYRVDVVFTGNEEKLSADAADAMAKWRAADGTTVREIPENGEWDLIIDGLFGIGLSSALDPIYAGLVARLNALGVPILALDVPSGLNADNGQPLGPPATAIRADHTVTFLALKPGLVTGDGPDYCGQLHLRTLDISTPTLYPPSGWLLDEAFVLGLMPRRSSNTHKASFGSVGILGGAESMLGAPLLAARASLKLGAGRVYVSLLSEAAPAVDPVQPELMLRRPAHLFELPHLSVLVAGPGLGHSATAGQWLARALETSLPLVLDADALNLISASSDLRELTKRRESATILTPHPAEAARLLGAAVEDVVSQRVEIARILAARFNAFAVLKGAGTICAMPNGTYFINSSGNPGLASAGTGDVLSGFIGALLAQGLAPRDAVLLGVYLHGAAADGLVAKGIGPIGMVASDVIEAGRDLLNRWAYGPRPS